MYKVVLLFGKDEVNFYLSNGSLTDDLKLNNLKDYSFNSDLERIAFLKGVFEAVGWQEVIEIEQE